MRLFISRLTLVGQEGQRIRVSNVGMWDSKSRTFSGLDAVYQGGRWVIATSTMQPSNLNGRFEEGSEKEPISGFWIAPGDAGYTITACKDESGPFVRIRATRPSSYLVIAKSDHIRFVHYVTTCSRPSARRSIAGLRSSAP